MYETGRKSLESSVETPQKENQEMDLIFRCIIVLQTATNEESQIFMTAKFIGINNCCRSTDRLNTDS